MNGDVLSFKRRKWYPLGLKSCFISCHSVDSLSVAKSINYYKNVSCLFTFILDSKKLFDQIPIWSEFHLLFVKLKQIIPEYILLSPLTLNQVLSKVLLSYNIITLCFEGGIRSRDEFSALLLQSFWHCSLTSFKKKNFIAFLKGWHCMIISAIWWVVHPVNISVANLSTVLVGSSKNGTSLSW